MPKDKLLTELTKKTIGNYLKKAIVDKDDKENNTHLFAKLSNKPGDKNQNQKDRRNYLAGEISKSALKSQNRTTGIDRAVDRLTKEDESQDGEHPITEEDKLMSKKPEVIVTPDTVADIVETAALDSLKPGSMTKVGMMQSVIGSMGAMNKDNLTKWFTDSIAIMGKYTDSLPANANADSNKATVNMKPSFAIGKGGPDAGWPMPKLSVKEDMAEMFVGQDLSEEFKEKTVIIVEAAVGVLVNTAVAKLVESYEAKLEEEIATIVTSLEEKNDLYLDNVTKTWLKENEVAIDASLKNELSEDFLTGLKNLFVEHYVEIPSNKVDIVTEMATKIETLEAELNKSIVENASLAEQVIGHKSVEIFEALAEGLTTVEVEKFRSFAEAIDYEDLPEFKKKLQVVKENYFTNKTTTTTTVKQSNIEEETFVGDATITEEKIDPVMQRYAASISKNR